MAVPHVHSPEQFGDHLQGYRAPATLIEANHAQEALTAELSTEQEKNASHLAEVDELQKGYDDKLSGFEVSCILVCTKLTRLGHEAAHRCSRKGLEKV